MNKSNAIRVKLQNAERIRRKLVEKNLLKKDLKIKKDDIYIYFPIKKNTKFQSYEILPVDFEKITKKPRSYKESNDISANLVNRLPTSYDVIGNIVLLKISDKELLRYSEKISRSILNVNKNVQTVCIIKSIDGEFRTRKIDSIYGEKKTLTQHKEFGMIFFVDVEKTYFSPRLANERKRIASQVKDNEIIVDMFSGVGPFSIAIAKTSNPKKIYSLDKNKEASKYATKNIKINKVLDKVEVHNKDSMYFYKNLENRSEKANRIIMNLPFSSYKFFKNALKMIDNRCIIHYYEIIEEKKINNRVNQLKQIAKKENVTIEKVKINKVKTYSPREFYICFDITAKRNMPM